MYIAINQSIIQHVYSAPSRSSLKVASDQGQVEKNSEEKKKRIDGTYPQIEEVIMEIIATLLADIINCSFVTAWYCS